MRITETVGHAAPPEVVFEMLSDPRFQELKCERSGAMDFEVVLDVEQDATTVVVRRRMATEGFPDFVKSFVGASVDVVETSRWGPADETGLRTAAVNVGIPRTPVTLDGSTTLAPGPAGGTQQTLDGDLRAAVPLVGRKIEQAVAPVIVRAVRLEAEVGREWLARG